MLRGTGDGRTAIPFGTLLAPAALVAFLWGPGIIGAWIGLLIR
jgi:hypothetical protein